MKRRDFIKKAGLATVAGSTMTLPLSAFDIKPKYTQLTILHTNDVHSRIEPFPMDGGKYQGKGGAAKRAALIKEIRAEEEHVLLLDAGDIFQGTPYFNFFEGELEFKLMAEMGYDAATIGNHDFDAGLEILKKQWSSHANFPLVSANYDFKDTVMEGLVEPYTVIKKGGLKIGVFGLGIELEGLVPAHLYGNTQYLDPISKASETAKILKHNKKCDYIICLSHLGYQYESDKISDVKLAAATEHIDLIIGGHTHTLMDAAEIHHNKNGEHVIINQVGWAGIALGRIDVRFEKNKKNKCISCVNEHVH